MMDMQGKENAGKRRERGGAGSGSGQALGICERCGRETDTLYSVQGRRLCQSCYSAGGAGGASLLSLIVERAAFALGVGRKLKVIPVPPPKKMGVRAPAPQEDGERRRKSLERFDLKERRMMMEEEGQLGIEPLSEGRKKERKPSPAARKKFFSQHSEKRK